jgi:hypothetical protein
MKLTEFLKQVGGSERDIVGLEGDEAMKVVQQDGRALQYVRAQTPEICMAAVKQYGYALRYVHVQTPELCMAAVRQDGNALRFVDRSVFET